MGWQDDEIIGQTPAPKTASRSLTPAQELRSNQDLAKAAARNEHARETATRILRSTQDALEQINKNPTVTTGPAAWITGSIPFTPAGALRQTIRGATSPIAIQELNRMRSESPTGGAMSNVSDRDMQILQEVYGSLNTAQNADQLRRSLNNVQEIYSKIAGTVPLATANLLHSMGRSAQRLEGGGIASPLLPEQSTMPVRQAPARSQGLTQEQVNQMYDEAINARSK